MNREKQHNHIAQLAPSGLGRSASLRAPGAGRSNVRFFEL